MHGVPAYMAVELYPHCIRQESAILQQLFCVQKQAKLLNMHIKIQILPY